MTPQTIADTLQADILSGALPPGTPLGQTELAARFGVSRIPVRDALAQLAAGGIITASPNRTATVLKLDTSEVEEMFHMRMLLECDLIGRAVPNMTSSDHSALDLALERSSLEARQDNWASGDQMFHAALYAPAKRPLQRVMADDLRRACSVQIASYDQLVEKTERWVTEHEGIVDACHAGDPKEAQRLLRRHLRAARNHLQKAMND